MAHPGSPSNSSASLPRGALLVEVLALAVVALTPILVLPNTRPHSDAAVGLMFLGEALAAILALVAIALGAAAIFSARRLGRGSGAASAVVAAAVATFAAAPAVWLFWAIWASTFR